MSALERLASEMTERLGTVLGAREILPKPSTAKGVAPAVYLGCALAQATEECAEEPRQNVIAVTSGSRPWRRWLQDAAETVGASRLLVLQLQVAPHWVHQRNLKGSKEVRLGTDYAQRLPWLTSLDTPVYVLQITGAVVDAEGKVLRSGAEGLWAVRSPFRVSALGAQKLVSDEDVEFVRQQARRTDLAGTPLVWQAALDELVSQLGGRSVGESERGADAPREPSAVDPDAVDLQSR